MLRQFRKGRQSAFAVIASFMLVFSVPLFLQVPHVAAADTTYRKCDTDSATYYIKHDGNNEVKVTVTASACVTSYYHDGRFWCSDITSSSGGKPKTASKDSRVSQDVAWNATSSTASEWCNIATGNDTLTNVKYCAKFTYDHTFPVSNHSVTSCIKTKKGIGASNTVKGMTTSQAESIVMFDKSGGWTFS